jgi:cytochrome c-type biogenesis protein CcmH
MREDISSLKQQLQHIQEQWVAGTLPPAQYEEEKAALERRLVDQVLASKSTPDGSVRLFAGIALVIVATAAAGYWWTATRAPSGSVNANANAHAGAMTGAGAPGMAGMAATAAPAMGGSAPHGTDSDQVASMVDRLAARLKDKPQDAEGWAMLARSYSVLARHADALKAYEKAVALRKDDANLLADYADSLAVQNNRVLAGEPIQLVERALKLEPHNLKALSMAGSEAFDRQDYKKAVQYWQQVVEFGALDSPMVQQVMPSLEQARQLAGLAPTAKPKLPAGPIVPGMLSGKM